MRASTAWPVRPNIGGEDGVERFAGGDADLRRHQVDAGQLLGDAVLHLQARVHFQKTERAVGQQRLHRAQTVVAGEGRHRGGLESRQLGPRQAGRRGLLDHLLVAALDGTLALERRHHALAIADELELDVPRSGETALQIHRPVSKRRARLGPRGGEGGHQFGFAVRPRHADAAPAGGWLQQHRIADAGGFGLQRVRAVKRLRAIVRGNTGGGHLRSGADFLAHRLDPARIRPDEANARGLHGAGEVRALGQKAVTRVQGVGLGLLCRRDQAFDVEVRVGGLVARQPRRGGGFCQMRRFAVDIRVGGHAVDAQVRASPHDPARHHGAVGDEHALEHERSVPRSAVPLR